MVLRRVVVAQSQNPPPISNHEPSPQPQPPSQTTPTCSQILPVPNPVTSYWLSQPHKYANLRSTLNLPQKCDIAIIGSGMAGVLTAYHILKNSTEHSCPKVILLDARQLCSGATGRNGGHVKVKTATLSALKDDEARNELQSYVLGVIQNLKTVVDDENLASESEFELRRSFDVFQDAEEAEKIKGVYDAAKKKGEKWTRNVAYIGAEMVEQVTSIRGAVGGFSVPAASLWPYKFVTGLLGRMVEKWSECLNVQMNTPVTSLSANDDGGNVLETGRGRVEAGKVVLATNAWTAGLLPDYEGTITPVKGMASHIVPSKPVHPHLTNTYNIHFAPSSSTGVDYLNPRPDGGIVVGGGAWYFKNDRETWFNNINDASRFSPEVEKYWTDSYMQKSFLGWEDSRAEPDCIWVGIMGNTGDGVPHIGRVPSAKGKEGGKKRQQWMLAGFNGGGMSFIATAAKAVAKMVVEDKEYEDVKDEFGLLGGIGTSLDRLEVKDGMTRE